MALTDELNDQETSQSGTADDSQRRRMMEFILRSALKPSLPSPQGTDERQPGQPPSPPTPGVDVKPNPPTPRLSTMTPPTLNAPPMPATTNLGGAMQPARPNVAPTRADFPAKPELGGWKKYLGLGLATLAGSAPLAEGILHGQRDAAERRYKQADQEWEQGLSDEAKQAQTENIRSEIKARENPKPEKPENLDREAYDFYVTGGMTPAEARKQVLKDAAEVKPEKPDTATQEDQRYEGIQAALSQKKPVSAEDSAWAKAYEKRKTLGPMATAGAKSGEQDTARSDRSYQFHVARVDKLREPVEARAERISRLEDTLNQNTPQSDALVAPELLSVMAGGQGSGLRMNEAEISRIVGGRTNWESIKAKLNAWQTDPSKGFALTAPQRQQTRQLFSAIKDRVGRKMSVIDEESQNLASTDDPQKHREIYNRLQKRLSDIDSGGASSGQIQVTDPNGGVHMFPDQASADRFKKLAKIQ